MIKSTYLPIKQQLLTLCMDMIIGENRRDLQCPYCLHANGDFSVTRITEGLLYKCFRDKCGKQGFVKSKIYEDFEYFEKDIKKSSGQKLFTQRTVNLNKEQQEFLYKQYKLYEEDILNNTICYCPSTKRFIFPLYNKLGNHIGYCARKFTIEKNEPKAVTYWHDDESPHIHYPYTTVKYPTYTYVIVEDVLSSIRIAKYIPSIALLGTNFPANAIEEHKNSNIYFALDKDATATAFKLQRKLGLFFQSCKVIPLKKDPKDMGEIELMDCVVNKITR